MLDNLTIKKIQIKALNVETGEFQSKILTLESGIRGECLIGRHQSCNIILNSPEVSRVHGRIFRLDGQCYFTDLGSANGSQINSEKVLLERSYRLKPNDLLRISRFVITFTDMSSEDLEQLNFPLPNYYQESFGSPKKQKKHSLTKFYEPKSSHEEVRKTPISKPSQTSFAAPLLEEGKGRKLDAEKKTEEVVASKNATASDSTSGSPVVVFAKSGKEIACDEEDFILDVAELEGIKLRSGCRMGICGACKLPLSEGKVDYDEEPECEPGHLLACIAKPNGRVVVEA